MKLAILAMVPISKLFLVCSPRFLCRLTALIKLLVAVNAVKRQRNLGLLVCCFEIDLEDIHFCIPGDIIKQTR